MAPIDVEKAIEELTLGEKVALTAGKIVFHYDNSTFYLLPTHPAIRQNAYHATQDATFGTQYPFRA